MRGIIVAILLLSTTIVASAIPSKEVKWKKANALYNSKLYDSAAILYEQLVQEGNNYAELYYNLGNSYYRINDISKAILNYKRSLKLDPNNTFAKENLALTESKISNRIQPIKRIFFIQWWQGITKGANATIWSILALIVFAMLVLGYIIQRTNLIAIKLPQPLILSFLFIWVITLTLAFVATDKKAAHKHAVVMINDSPLMQEPNNSKPISLIPEGTTVKTIKISNSWSEVILPDGRRGWIETELIEKI